MPKTEVKQFTAQDLDERLTYLKYKYWSVRRDLVVCGIATGGIVPAVKLADLLGCEYRNIRPDKPLPYELGEFKSILFFDDIIDSGTTEAKVMELAKKYGKLTYFDALVLRPECWIQFGWETTQDKPDTRQTDLCS